ncbi:MAG: hypothetical protein IH845_04385 [Nanoarchaeota archaeon]|nr:hypothetical protein [Nanoarchaeota archaeon]
MENKKLGTLMLVFSLVFAGFLLYFNSALNQDFVEAGCLLNEECRGIDNNIGAVHFGFGFFGFMLGLAFYLLLFNKTDERIMKRLENDRDAKISADKFSILLQALDPFEQKVMKAVMAQDGITQNTLRIRTDMSKAKLSYVLQELERRNLIKRERKGKTLAIFLKI